MQAHTGPPLYLPEEIPEDAAWTPYAAIEPMKDHDGVYEDEVHSTDVYEADVETITNETGSVDDEPMPDVPVDLAQAIKEGIDPEKHAMILHYL